MGLRDILKEAINIAGVPISDKQFIRDYNRAVHDLAMLYDTAKIRDTEIIECTDVKEEYPLKEGCIKIERVLTSHGNYFSFFKVRGNSKIQFAIKDVYTVYELFDQPPVSTMDDEVTINPLYFKAIAEYIAAKAIKKSEPDRANELMAESTSDAALANKNIRQANNQNRRVYTPMFR